MDTLTRLCVSLLLACVWAAQPVAAQGRLDAHTLKDVGGTYQLDCADNASPKLTVFADALVYLHGARRVAGARPEAAASFMGRNPPPGYRTVLLSEAPGGHLRVAISQDRRGHYLELDADPKVQAAIGKAFGAQKFRRCDGGATVQAATAPAPAIKTYALHELDAGGVMLDPRLEAAHLKALGPLVREPWLARLDGPSAQNKRMKVAGTDFVKIAACKNHDCFDHNAVFLYSAEQNLFHGIVHQRGRSTLVGQPTPAVAAALPVLWQREFRSAPR